MSEHEAHPGLAGGRFKTYLFYEREEEAEAGERVPARAVALEDGAVWVSVREAARRLGVSPACVYGYVRRGKLARRSVEGRMMLRETEVLALRGERAEPLPTPQRMLMLMAPLRAGGRAGLAAKLERFREQQKHILPGVFRQSSACDETGPGRVLITCFWQPQDVPSQGKRQRALAALVADLVDLCDWDQGIKQECQVYLSF